MQSNGAIPEGGGSATYWDVAVKNSRIRAENIEALWLDSHPSLYLEFALRGQGDSYLGHNAYLLQVWDWYEGFSKRALLVVIVRVTNSTVLYAGGWTTLRSVTCSDCVEENNSLWVRFRVEGSQIKAKVCPNGKAEPTIAWATDGRTAAF